MDELLHKRIVRSLEGLDDEQARKIIDYVDFLQSKYGDRSNQPSTIERIADGVEDTLRVGKVPFAAIKGTRSVLNTADKFVKGVTDAGRAVVDEIQSQLQKAEEEAGGGGSNKPEQESPKSENQQQDATDKKEDTNGG